MPFELEKVKHPNLYKPEAEGIKCIDMLQCLLVLIMICQSIFWEIFCHCKLRSAFESMQPKLTRVLEPEVQWHHKKCVASYHKKPQSSEFFRNNFGGHEFKPAYLTKSMKAFLKHLRRKPGCLTFSVFCFLDKMQVYSSPWSLIKPW